MATTVRSMIDTTPVVEQLPVYTRRPVDPETASILSAAPSYCSEAPPYDYVPPPPPLTHVTSTAASSQTHQMGIPNLRYAPGFTPRAGGSVGDVANHSYNVASWSSVRTSGAIKQYENVARRRVESGKAVVGLLGGMPTSETTETKLEPTTSSSGGAPTPAVAEEPFSPLEDPALVGEAAAAAAKASRLYREKCIRGEDTLKAENRSWDFMLGQMADWEERERSWNKFRDEVSRGRRMKLVKRIGANTSRR